MNRYDFSADRSRVEVISTTFDCNGDRLTGVLHRPSVHGDLGVLVLVGGRQYRVGGSRLFVHFARKAADSGVPVFRFDPRGIGDSQGDPRPYHDLREDVRAAVDHFQYNCPSVQRLVIWGICDGASAAVLYARQDPRICGLVLLNPWIESSQAHARSKLSEYYRRRLLHSDTWAGLVTGRINPVRAAWDLVGQIGRSLFLVTDATSGVPSSSVLATEFSRFRGHRLLILSGRDQTAAAFRNATESSAVWTAGIQSPLTITIDVPNADHTFSRNEWTQQVIDATLHWLKDMN